MGLGSLWWNFTLTMFYVSEVLRHVRSAVAK